MSKISNLFARHWRNMHFILIIILISVLFFGNKIVVTYVNQITYTVFYSPFDKIKRTYLTLKTTSEENDQLKTLLTEASLTISTYEETIKENKRLRSVLGFEPTAGHTLVPAKVISISGEIIPTSAIINKGASDSIYIDQPVINQFGLIGRITSVSPNNAIVQLLTDPSNRVAARLVRSREMGIIKFTSSEGMLLDNLPIQGDAVPGDTIISSGLGGVYPAGLKVGLVKNVFKEELETFCHVNVEPFANFFSIDELFIVRKINND